MSTIAIKTGSGKWDGSNARAVLEICNSESVCCQTSSAGRGLYNGKYRGAGQTEVYKNTTILGNCAQEVISILTLDPKYKRLHPLL